MPSPALKKVVKNALAAGFCLAIAGFALSSLGFARSLFAPLAAPAALEAKDDPVRNGLQIIERRDAARNQGQAGVGAPAVILLNDWNFTFKPNPSNYQ